MSVAITVASTELERERCFALRYRVYVEEQGRQPKGADHDRKLDRNADDETGTLLCASIDGELVGTVRIHHGATGGIPPFVSDACDVPRLAEETPLAQIAAMSRLAVDARHRGGTTVVSLLRSCFAHLTSEGRETKLLLILAFDQPGLLAMYRLLGFRTLEPARTYETDLGRTVPMAARIRG
jgi:predicted GNAT family N-acyltransferase